jgi:RNA polymerase sigma-70 factor (ECF subfamily)
MAEGVMDWMPKNTEWSETTWKELVSHSKSLEAFLRRKMQNPADAEDIAQETFAGIVKNSNNHGTEPKYPKTFLTTAGQRKLIDNAKGERIRFAGDKNRVSFEDGDKHVQFLETIAAQTPDPVQQIARKEALGQIRAAVKKMTPQYQRVYEVFFEGDHSHEETAQLTGLKVPAVKSAIHRIREQLREIDLIPAEAARGGRGRR